MGTIARSFTRVAAALVLAAQFIAVPAAVAGPGETPYGTWLAASSSGPVVGTNWGRLALRDGNLTFSATNADWQLPITEIKRISISEQSDRLIVIEGAGETHYVAILGQQMLVESPRKALEIIQKSLRVPAARRE